MCWIFLLCTVCVLYQIIYECILLNAISRHKKSQALVIPKTLPSVSVIICAKDEAGNLSENLPFIINQHYPDFEIIVVDDGSQDHTIEVIKKIQLNADNIKLVIIPKEEKGSAGKKYALRKGIENARNKVILLTDADCQPASQNWILEMASLINDPHKIVLGISPYKKADTILNGLIEYETMQTALQYIGFALLGNPYMSVGRNVCFDKKLWQSKTWTSAELAIASGDDDLAIQTLATGENTTVCLAKESYTFSEAKKTWPDWLKQKLRHYESGKLYKLSHRLLLGSYLSAKLLFYLLFILSLVTMHHRNEIIIFLIIYFLLCVLGVINIVAQKKLQMLSRWNGVVIYDVLYSIFTVILGCVSPLKSNKHWK